MKIRADLLHANGQAEGRTGRRADRQRGGQADGRTGRREDRQRGGQADMTNVVVDLNLFLFTNLMHNFFIP
jgi:hypothetical protein